MKKRKMQERKFKCPKCQYVAIAYKNSGKMTKQGHLKNMWCPYCKEEHNFIQMGKYE